MSSLRVHFDTDEPEAIVSLIARKAAQYAEDVTEPGAKVRWRRTANLLAEIEAKLTAGPEFWEGTHYGQTAENHGTRGQEVEGKS